MTTTFKRFSTHHYIGIVYLFDLIRATEASRVKQHLMVRQQSLEIVMHICCLFFVFKHPHEMIFMLFKESSDQKGIGRASETRNTNFFSRFNMVVKLLSLCICQRTTQVAKWIQPNFFAMIQTLTVGHLQNPKRFHSGFVGMFCLLLPLRP